MYNDEETGKGPKRQNAWNKELDSLQMETTPTKDQYDAARADSAAGPEFRQMRGTPW